MGTFGRLAYTPGGRGSTLLNVPESSRSYSSVLFNSLHALNLWFVFEVAEIVNGSDDVRTAPPHVWQHVISQEDAGNPPRPKLGQVNSVVGLWDKTDETSKRKDVLHGEVSFSMDNVVGAVNV